jgi:xylan 1,4-beta-xylosidase
MLSDDVGVIFRDRDGSLHHCFSGLKRIVDAGLKAGVKPFFELSFMPAALASDPVKKICHYAGITSPPKDHAAWAELVRRTVGFLVETYGIDEVSGWWFEVWNEPNIPFWSGDQEGYFKLYAAAAHAVKRVDPRLRVGGPATARAAWVADLLAWCARNGAPIDFVSTHIYPSDVPFMEAAHGDVNLLGMDFIHGHFKRVREEADAAGFSGPIIWGEWNSSAGPLMPNHDDCNNAALVAGALAGIERWGDGSLYWNLSDIYEECEYHFAPFHGGYGLYTVDGVAKSAARAFEFFRELLPMRHELDGLPESAARGALFTTDAERRSAVVLLWNHLADENSPAVPWQVEIDPGAVGGAEIVRREILPGAGSACETWSLQVRSLAPAEKRPRPRRALRVHHRLGRAEKRRAHSHSPDADGLVGRRHVDQARGVRRRPVERSLRRPRPWVGGG